MGLSSFISASFAASTKPAGIVTKANGSSTASGKQGNRRLRTRSNIFQGDRIKTGFSGLVHIQFTDKTKLVIGPRSTLTINQFVLAGNGTANSFAIKAVRGTFRFLSGKSRKSVYKISTQNATIGIRGTGFDFAYFGRTSVVLYTGSVIVCKGASCVTLRRKCEMAVEKGRRMQKSSTNQLVPGAFKLIHPYIRRENNLQPAYRLQASSCDSGVGTGVKGGNGSDGGG